MTEGCDMADMQGSGESVLVVDDEAQQCDIAREMFAVLGYQVESVRSGEEAVEYLREKEVDLLLLDMIMDPGINGRETYEQISEFRPEQRAVIASGFSETEDVKTTQNLGAGVFIRKPYTLSQLGMAVKQALVKK